MRLLMFTLAVDDNDPVLGFVTRWIGALARRVDSIDVVTMRTGACTVPDNVRVLSVGAERGHSEPRRALEFYRHLAGLLRRRRIDVCFSHMIPIFTVLAAPLLRLARVPIVTWYAHRSVTSVLKAAHHLSAVVVTSAESAYRYRRDRLVVVGQGIDTGLFAPDGQAVHDPPRLLSVGRLSPIKDLLTLVEAIGRLRADGIPVRCGLLGSAPEQDRAYVSNIRARIAGLGLDGAVEFHGPMPNREVVPFYRRSLAHVNLCPTGALDKAVLEAMACATPSLVANEGFRETLGPWAEALLFRHGHPGDLAGKVAALIRMEPAQRRALGLDLREQVVRRHALDRLAARLVELFDEVRTR